MARFVNELFSIQIDPPKGVSNAFCVTYSLYEGGLFSVRTSRPYAEEAESQEAQAFYAKDPKDLLKIQTFMAEWRNPLKDIPTATGVNEDGLSSFNLVFEGKEIYGSYVYHDLEEAKASGKFNKNELKMIDWNNRIVKMLEAFFALVKSLNSSLLQVAPQAPELFDLRPAPRYLMSLVLGDPDCHLEHPSTFEECIKAAAHKAFEGEEALDGKSFNEVYMAIKVNALPLLEKAASLADFDKAHSAFVHALMEKSFGKLDYARAAYWLDLTYIYALLTKSLIRSERLVGYLHAPASPKDLQEENGAVTEAAYLFFQDEGRKEFGLLHISPAYFYLEGIFAKAHPEPSSPTPHQA
jgi:hypothetical protein